MSKELKYSIKHLLLISIPTLAISYLFSIFVYLSEKGVNPQFQTIEDTTWWWISTISTVGFGDISPITNGGRLFGGVVILSSFLIFAIVIAQLSNTIRLMYNYSEMGYKRIKHKNHIIVVGYTSMTSRVIDILRKRYPHTTIVLIDETLERNPFSDVGFVKGSPLNIDVLNRSNVINSVCVVVLGKESLHNPDAFTLVVSSEIERLNNKILTVAELSNENLISVYRNAKVDYLIREQDLIKGIIDLENPSLQFIKELDKKIASS